MKILLNKSPNRRQLLQRIWAIGFPEVSGGKLVLYLGPEALGLLRLFAIARVANPK
ncbi:hypothetical protein D3C85_664570 [compost metagenome]